MTDEMLAPRAGEPRKWPFLNASGSATIKERPDREYPRFPDTPVDVIISNRTDVTTSVGGQGIASCMKPIPGRCGGSNRGGAALAVSLPVVILRVPKKIPRTSATNAPPLVWLALVAWRLRGA